MIKKKKGSKSHFSSSSVLPSHGCGCCCSFLSGSSETFFYQNRTCIQHFQAPKCCISHVHTRLQYACSAPGGVGRRGEGRELNQKAMTLTLFYGHPSISTQLQYYEIKFSLTGNLIIWYSVSSYWSYTPNIHLHFHDENKY